MISEGILLLTGINFYCTINDVRVYLDCCAYNRPFDDQSQIRISLEAQAKLYIQRLIINKEIDLVFSYMSVYENSENPNVKSQSSIRSFFRYAYEYIDIDKANIINEHAATLIKWNVKSNDAIHLACAIESKCDHFITTDDGILKNYHGEDITVCSP